MSDLKRQISFADHRHLDTPAKTSLATRLFDRVVNLGPLGFCGFIAGVVLLAFALMCALFDAENLLLAWMGV